LTDETPNDNKETGAKPSKTNVVGFQPKVAADNTSGEDLLMMKDWRISVTTPLGATTVLEVHGQLSVQSVFAIFGEDPKDVKFMAPLSNIDYVVSLDDDQE